MQDDWLLSNGANNAEPVTGAHVRSKPTRVGIAMGHGEQHSKPTKAERERMTFPAPHDYQRPSIWGPRIEGGSGALLGATGEKYGGVTAFGTQEQRPLSDPWGRAQLSLPDYHAYYKPLRWDEGGHVFGKEERGAMEQAFQVAMAQLPAPGQVCSPPPPILSLPSAYSAPPPSFSRCLTRVHSRCPPPHASVSSVCADSRSLRSTTRKRYTRARSVGMRRQAVRATASARRPSTCWTSG